MAGREVLAVRDTEAMGVLGALARGGVPKLGALETRLPWERGEVVDEDPAGALEAGEAN